jgi:hypothetical protein
MGIGCRIIQHAVVKIYCLKSHVLGILIGPCPKIGHNKKNWWHKTKKYYRYTQFVHYSLFMSPCTTTTPLCTEEHSAVSLVECKRTPSATALCLSVQESCHPAFQKPGKFLFQFFLDAAVHLITTTMFA